MAIDANIKSVDSEIRFDNCFVVSVNLDGWVPVQVEYVYAKFSFADNLCWRIKGTSHVFKIDLPTIYKHHGSKIEEHFPLALRCFREDFIDWVSNNDPRANRYINEFGKLICL